MGVRLETEGQSGGFGFEAIFQRHLGLIRTASFCVLKQFQKHLGLIRTAFLCAKPFQRHLGLVRTESFCVLSHFRDI